MYRNTARRIVCLVASLGAIAFLEGAPALASSKAPAVGFATRHAKSKRLSEYKFVGPVEPRTKHVVFNEVTPKKGAGRATRVSDPVAQTQFGLSQPEPLVQFEGASEDDNAAVVNRITVPPDTEGDVGPNHYIQYINNVAVMYDKSGNIAFGPVAGNAFWSGLGGPCEIQNDGDPLVRYDRQADRWVFSQFALPNYPEGPFYQCFAVSTTNDPTGEYFQYEFKTSDDFFTDYGKLGVWPDAYYMSFNMFGPAGAFLGGAYAFDRGAMLVGAPAGMIAFDLGQQGGALPSDLDGPTPPPAGSPNYFMTFDINPARLLEWQFHVDWTTPANSTLTGPVEIPVADFVYPVCDAFRGQCVPQFETSEKLETLDDKLMYRLVYRNFGDHESLVVNHTVGTASGSAAPRWYEVRQPGDAPVVYQQGTYAPDAAYRWMGSIAMDGHGNIALGYSKSSSTTYPSIGITGRLAGDPPGLMGAEDVWFAGGGSQIASFSRWGDYSTMSIDPTDDCTFWYTQEYYAESGGFDFKTRIGAFRFASCTAGPAGSLEGTVTAKSGAVAGATVEAAPQNVAAGASSTTTDDAGHYQFLTLPSGTYDVTVSKYGYQPVTIAGVAVETGANTVQDVTLQAAVNVLVNGTVKDAGHGWPLYAKLVVTGPNGFPGATLFTDPVTGYYSIDLPSGFTYAFAVASQVPGYAPGGGPLTVPVPAVAASGNVVANWTVAAAPTCTAPGYGPGTFADPPALSEGFDAGVIPPGWTVKTISPDEGWTVYTDGDPCGQFDGNRTGGSGPYAIVNSACGSLGYVDDSFLETPPINLAGNTSAAIRWANDFIDYVFYPAGSVAAVDASVDGGATWTNVWTATSDVPGPGTQSVDMSFAAGHADVRARFHYEGTFAPWWQVDDVQVGAFSCSVLPGGLVVGNVGSANTGAALNGATVRNLPDDGSTTTFATPDDPDRGDGFYALFAGSGSQPFEASYPAYEPLTKSVTVVPNGTVRLDFALGAGLLSASPRPLSMFTSPGAAQSLTLNLTNTGSAAGGYVIHEVDAPPSSAAAGPATLADPADVLAALRRVGFARLNDPDQSDLPAPAKAPADVPLLAQAGHVVSSFSTGLSEGRGLAYDTDADRLWVSSPSAPEIFVFGDGFDHQYLPDGTPTGDTIDIHETGGPIQADGTYNGRTGMLWQVNVGGDNCLFEMDPVAKVVTGKKICGSWTANSQRALAYDYSTDTYYVGGSNEATVYHIDGSGAVLDSKYVGLGMAGLAFNPSTRHLFALTEFAAPFEVWVLDTADHYNVLGGFVVTSGGVPVLQNDGINLEADCNGHLWVNTRYAQIVYEFESGETGWCVDDIPWLSETPSAASVPTGSSLPVTVTFDPAGLLPGLRQGSLVFATDTPDPVAPVPVDFTLLFNDVPQGSFAWNFIYGAAGAGVMPGCAPQTPTYTFCPNEVVTRRTMAGFIERAVHGALTPPPVYLGEFGDVASGSFNANYIQGLVDDRITAGCSLAPPLYCPDVPVTRAQMAVFVWKGEHGSEPPPPCTPPGTFADVPCPGGFAVDYIEGIYAEGVTAGCGSGDFCPNSSITNAQMAVFLVKAFQIPYVP